MRNWTIWNKSDEFWNSVVNSLFYGAFSSLSSSSSLKLPPQYCWLQADTTSFYSHFAGLAETTEPPSSSSLYCAYRSLCRNRASWNVVSTSLRETTTGPTAPPVEYSPSILPSEVDWRACLQSTENTKSIPSSKTRYSPFLIKIKLLYCLLFVSDERILHHASC